MNFILTLKMAIRGIFDNKIRTLLTMLGVIIGVSTFITLISLGQGTQKSITDSIESMGTNLITVQTIGRGSNREVTYEQIDAFAKKNTNLIQAIAPVVNGSVTLKHKDISVSTSVESSSPEYESVKNISLQNGRFIMKSDVDSRKNVAVIGTAVVNNLFSAVSNPIGQQIKVDGQIFKVIGVLSQVATGVSNSQDDKIIIPITTGQRLLKTSQIRTFYIQAKTSETVDLTMSKIEEFMLKTYESEDSYRIQNQADMLSKVSDITGTMTTFLGFVAGISLLVGGIGIMNIMLVSVTERTREIGIRKSIGAKRKNILSQFLIESIIISCLGGVIGILLGYLFTAIISKFSSLTPVITVSSVITSFTVSGLVGIFFGIYPANKASKLNPIEALRYQ